MFWGKVPGEIPPRVYSRPRWCYSLCFAVKPETAIRISSLPHSSNWTFKENLHVTWSPQHTEKNYFNWYCFPSRCSTRYGKYCVRNRAQGKRGPGVPPRCAPHLLRWEPAYSLADHPAQRSPLQEALPGAGGQESCHRLWGCQPGGVCSNHCQVQLYQSGMSSGFFVCSFVFNSVTLSHWICFITVQSREWEGQLNAISVKGESLYHVIPLTIGSISMSICGLVESQLLFSKLLFVSYTVFFFRDQPWAKWLIFAFPSFSRLIFTKLPPVSFCYLNVLYPKNFILLPKTSQMHPHT